MVEGRALSKYGWKVIRLGRLDILGDVDKFIRKIRTVVIRNIVADLVLKKVHRVVW